jgi:hypothetical protein
LPPAKNYNNLVLTPVVRVAATEAKRIAVSEVLRDLHMPIHPIATVLAAFPELLFRRWIPRHVPSAVEVDAVEYSRIDVDERIVLA